MNVRHSLRTAAAGAVALLTLVAGCSSSEDTPGSPADGASDDGTGLISAPSDYESVEGDGFAIAAPADYEETRTPSATGEETLFLEKDSSDSGLPSRVAVILDPDPEQDVEEQSTALETVKDATRESIEPRGEDDQAFLLTWEEPTLVAGEAVPTTYWQLMYASGDTIYNVVALAPEEDFAGSEVTTILRTFTPA